MKKWFSASLCYEGAHGGAIITDEEDVVYKTQVQVLPDEYKYIKIPYSDIQNVYRNYSLLIFPSVTINLKNGSKYKFIIFNRKRFLYIMNSRNVKII
jgi:hypothetical protein